MMIVGVVAPAFAMPPVISLLIKAYGIGSSLNQASATVLSAPQGCCAPQCFVVLEGCVSAVVVRLGFILLCVLL